MKDTLVTLLKSRIVWLLILLVLGLHYVGKMDFEDALRQQTTYCQMVSKYKETNGAVGWPDYQGTYNSACPIKLGE